jgi:alpha-glucosidase
MNQRDKLWWRHGIFYQIYPRSFQDTNADGVGDINGIIERLPYLQSLGVDAIWLSPIFPSPMADFGYDIADYTGVDPLFGTMAGFDALVKAAHAGGLKVILDLVPNHTSDQHPWFLESRASRDNQKRDWYIWRDPAADGGPPNNWLSEFGGSAWQYDATTGQYYYHAFLAQQPDLNWRNPEVRQAVYDVMRFWLRKGVDGFRVDVIWHLIKDAEFRDNPPNPNYREGRPPHEKILPLHSTDQAEVHDVIAQMRRVVDEFDSRVLIGEIYLPLERLVTYYGKELAGAHLPFNFALLSAPWNAREIEKIIFEYESVLPVGAWPNWVLGNHDRPRVASRVGQAQARVAAMLLLTLRGTPTLYYGDEIGMHQVAIAPEEVRDPFEKNVPGIGVGRDGCRTPMQWDATPYAGFSTSAPWLPLAEDFRHENVANLDADAASILSLYRALINLRKKLPQLISGDYVPIAAEGDLLLYRRRSDGKAITIALNLGAEPVSIESDAAGLSGEILLSTFLDRQGEKIQGALDLRGDEGVIIGHSPAKTMSSRRRRDPYAAALRLRTMATGFCRNMGLSLWVPAFAGTTRGEALRSLTPDDGSCLPRRCRRRCV